MLEELDGAKSVKIFIKEDLNQSNSLQVLSKTSSIEILQEDSVEVEEVNIIVKEELLKEVEKAPEEVEEVEQPEQQQQQPVEDWLALSMWSNWLDAYTTEDNPNVILWKLKSSVQKRIW